LKEFSNQRFAGESPEFTFLLAGEEVTARPPKRSGAMVKILTVDRNDDMKQVGYTQALMEFFEDALDRTHRKTRRRPGHGQESVEGCQACRMYDRLDLDDDEPGALDLEACLEAANWLVGEVSARPTG
jgi:hypothetical protein